MTLPAIQYGDAMKRGEQVLTCSPFFCSAVEFRYQTGFPMIR